MLGNKILCAKTGSNTQHGHYAHKSSPELENIVCTNDDPRMTLTYITARSILEMAFTWEKVKTLMTLG